MFTIPIGTFAVMELGAKKFKLLACKSMIMNNSFRDMAYEINYNRNFIII